METGVSEVPKCVHNPKIRRAARATSQNIMRNCPRVSRGSSMMTSQTASLCARPHPLPTQPHSKYYPEEPLKAFPAGFVSLRPVQLIV